MNGSDKIALPAENLTLVGAFNPMIFQPRWLEKHLGHGAPYESFLSETLDLVLVGKGVTWVVNPRRLVINGAPEETSRMAGSLLRVLPHTPIHAAGFNFSRKLRCATQFQAGIGLRGTPPDFAKLLGGDHKAIAVTEVVRLADDAELTLKLLWVTPLDVSADFNFNKDCIGKPLEAVLGHLARSAAYAQDVDRLTRELPR